MSAANPPLLQVKNLKVNFKTDYGNLRAVDDVSIRVKKGQTLGVVGESGSGKSVLSRAVLGLLPRTASITADSILFEEKQLFGMAEESFRKMRGKELAIIFQDPMTSLNPTMTVGKQITETLREHLKFNKKEALERAEDLLASVGIPSPAHRIKEYPHQLSGGMRQRVVIAIALSCEPKLLIADEPTTALDVTVQAQILDLLRKYQQDHNMTMILITHDLGVVAGHTDEIAVMYAGKVVEQASTKRLFKHMRMPYTEALLNSIPRLAEQSHVRLQTISGRPPNLTRPLKGCRFHPRCHYTQEPCRQTEPQLLRSNEAEHYFACWYPFGGEDPV